jgi:hypothetical protein
MGVQEVIDEIKMTANFFIATKNRTYITDTGRIVIYTGLFVQITVIRFCLRGNFLSLALLLYQLPDDSNLCCGAEGGASVRLS